MAGLAALACACQTKRRFLDYSYGKCICTNSLSVIGNRCTCNAQARALSYLKEQFLGAWRLLPCWLLTPNSARSAASMRLALLPAC